MRQMDAWTPVRHSQFGHGANRVERFYEGIKLGGMCIGQFGKVDVATMVFGDLRLITSNSFRPGVSLNGDIARTSLKIIDQGIEGAIGLDQPADGRE